MDADSIATTATEANARIRSPNRVKLTDLKRGWTPLKYLKGFWMLEYAYADG